MDCVRVDTNAAYAGLEQALAWVPEREGPYADVYGDHGDIGTKRGLRHPLHGKAEAYGEDGAGGEGEDRSRNEADHGEKKILSHFLL